MRKHVTLVNYKVNNFETKSTYYFSDYTIIFSDLKYTEFKIKISLKLNSLTRFAQKFIILYRYKL